VHPAADDPAAQAALTGYQAGAIRWLAGGAIAVALGFLGGAAAVEVAESGRRLPGVGLVVVVLIIGGLAAAVAGTGALLRARRWRHALRRDVWVRGVLRIAGPAIIAFEPEGFDELNPFDEPVRMRLMSTSVWRTRAVQQLNGAEIRAARVGEHEWVLTAEGLETLYGAREVRRRA
jgi:hypothetical protein